MEEAPQQTFEEEVGITEFLSSTEKFRGILKQRFSDFIVRELSKDGEVCKLSSCNGKELEKSTFSVEDVSADRSPEEVCAAFSAELKDILQSTCDPAARLSDESWTKIETPIKDFAMGCISGVDAATLGDNSDISVSDKATRTAVHQLIRKHLTKWVDSETLDGVRIRMLPRSVSGGGKGAAAGGGGGVVAGLKRKRIEWPSSVGNYLQFTMMKENVDTMSAIAVLNKAMRLKPGAIEYNGTKDKRGITAQKCTIFRRRPSDFGRVNNYKLNPIIRLGDFKYVKEPSKLGSLGGNRFDITLRNITIQDEAVINAACTALAGSGFINYYGLQRFGKGVAKSHYIGRELLKSNWEGCVRLLFARSDEDSHDVKEVKDLFHAGDYKQALQKIPDKMHAEKTVLRVLAQKPNDYGNAYGSVAKHVRLMCAHAYQSCMFNKAASKRVREFGLQVVEGDLVPADGVDALELDDGEDAATAGDDGDENLVSVSISASAVENETSTVDAAKKPNTGSASSSSSSSSSMPLVHIVTAEDVQLKKYSIYDVLLPLPGSSIVLPTHSVGAYYQELLAADDLSLETYSTCNVIYRMKGTYRKVVQKCQGFSWSVVSYDKPDEELVETELTQFRNTADGTVEQPETTLIRNRSRPDGSEGKDFPLKALKMQFSLPPGTYATMLLRELTKESTECMFQAQLSNRLVLISDDAAEPETGAATASAAAAAADL